MVYAIYLLPHHFPGTRMFINCPTGVDHSPSLKLSTPLTDTNGFLGYTQGFDRGVL